MSDYTAEITNADVIVGRDEGNHFSIEIKPSSKSLENVIVRLSIPCGVPQRDEKNTFLFKDDGDYAEVNYYLPRDSENPIPIDTAPEEDDSDIDLPSLAWETPSTGISIPLKQMMRIDVTEFGSNVPKGNAPVSIGIRTLNDEQFDKKELVVDVKPPPGETGKPEVIYFDAHPDYVLHAGEEEVTLSFYTTGANSVTLYKNNTKVWPPPGGSNDLFFKDTPAITSVYRLEAGNRETEDRIHLLEEGLLVSRELTVQVAQAGWNRQPLHQGYPTLLLAANSFKSGESERLYGIFVKPETDTTPEAAGLYSSETGFAPWRKEAGSFPKSMSHSPGVAYDNKLWLIGGSSVHPTERSKKVWCYERDKHLNTMKWVQQSDGGFTPRMGHSCVVFDKKIWVLGGRSEEIEPHNDVWCYDAESRKWSEKPNAPWEGRCMFAAAATPKTEGFQPRIWVYGGTEDADEIVPKKDLWSTEDGESWKEEKNFTILPDPGMPSGATLYFDKRLHLAGTFKNGEKDEDEKIVRGTISAHVFSLCADLSLWEDNPVSWGWEQYGGNPFLMQSIIFNRFLFFWSLYQNIETVPKLNIFIPS